MTLAKGMCAVVALIGVYMVAVNVGGGMLTPPVLSGVAFVLLGIKPFVK